MFWNTCHFDPWLRKERFHYPCNSDPDYKFWKPAPGDYVSLNESCPPGFIFTSVGSQVVEVTWLWFTEVSLNVSHTLLATFLLIQEFSLNIHVCSPSGSSFTMNFIDIVWSFNLAHSVEGSTHSKALFRPGTNMRPEWSDHKWTALSASVQTWH